MNRRPLEANSKLVSMVKTRNKIFDVDRIFEYGLECFEIIKTTYLAGIQHLLAETVRGID
jgi:hypothetical protein